MLSILIAIYTVWRAERHAARDRPRTNRIESSLRAKVAASTFPRPPPGRRVRWVVVALVALGLLLAGAGVAGLLGRGPSGPSVGSTSVKVPLTSTPAGASPPGPDAPPPAGKGDTAPVGAAGPAKADPPPDRSGPRRTEVVAAPVVAPPTIAGAGAPPEAPAPFVGVSSVDPRRSRAALWPAPDAPDRTLVDRTVIDPRRRVEGAHLYGMEADDVRIVSRGVGSYEVRFLLRSDSRPALRLPKETEQRRTLSWGGEYTINTGDGRFVLPDDRLACRSTSAQLGEWQKPPLRLVGRNTLRVSYFMKCDRPLSAPNLRFLSTLEQPGAANVRLNVGAAISY